MKIKKLSSALIIATALAVAPAMPASASGAVVSISDTVLYPGCYDHDYTYSIDVPTAQHWNLDIDISDPTGALWDFEFEYGDGPVSGTVDTFICSSDMPGTYTADWVLTLSGDPDQIITGSDMFVLRAAKSQTGLTVSDKYPENGQVLKFTVKSEVETLNGYFGTSYADIVLERKLDGKWQRVPKSKVTTNDTGKAVLKYRWTKDSTPGPVRARTLPDEDSRLASVSPKVHIHRS